MQKNESITFLLIFYVVFILSQNFCFAVKTSKITSAGQEIINGEKKIYPRFDYKKVAKEAEKQYPLLKEGEEIAITYRRDHAKGKFYGIEGNFAKIGSSRVPLIDIPLLILSKLDKKKNAKLRKDFIAIKRKNYYQKRKEYLEELTQEIYEKYPKLDKSQIEILFSNIDDKEKINTYLNEYETIFYTHLPIENSKSYARETTLEQFMKKYPELVLVNGRVFEVKKIEEKKKAEVEKKANSLAKIKARILFPKTATPVFEPDGGKITGEDNLKITCSTKGTVIRYTLDGKTPDIESPVYLEPIPMTDFPNVKAIAFHPEYNDSNVAQLADYQRPNGLFRSYYTFLDFTGPVVTQVDKNINFQWTGGESPHQKPHYIPCCMNTAIWTGQIQPKFTEKYTLYLTVDDAARLWLNGKLTINSWKEQGPTEIQRTVNFKAGRKYHLKITFSELYESAGIKFEWSSPSTPREVVPTSALFPDGKYTNIVKKWNAAKDKSKLKNPGAYKGSYKLSLKTNNPSRLHLIYSKKIADERERSDYVRKHDLRQLKKSKKSTKNH